MKPKPLFTFLLIFALPTITHSAELNGKVSSNKNGRGLTNALVHVVSGVAPGVPLAKRKPPKLLIRDGGPDPKVLVVLSGETFTITSTDGSPYNVQLRFRESMELHLAIGGGGEFPTTKAVKAGTPELFAPVTDDLHTLNGYLCILEQPFYALTDANGIFKLSGLPAGTYAFEATHPKEGRLRREVTVGTTSATADFVLQGR